MMYTIHTRQCTDYLSNCVQACSSDLARTRLYSATSTKNVQERNLATEPSLWPGQLCGTVFLQQLVKQTLSARSSANWTLTLILCFMIFNFLFVTLFCTALSVRVHGGRAVLLLTTRLLTTTTKTNAKTIIAAMRSNTGVQLKWDMQLKVIKITRKTACHCVMYFSTKMHLAYCSVHCLCANVFQKYQLRRNQLRHQKQQRVIVMVALTPRHQHAEQVVGWFSLLSNL